MPGSDRHSGGSVVCRAGARRSEPARLRRAGHGRLGAARAVWMSRVSCRVSSMLAGLMRELSRLSGAQTRMGPLSCRFTDMCSVWLRLCRRDLEAIRVLSRLAYLTLCRSIQLLALLARGDAAKDLELLVLGHQLSVLRRQVPRPGLEPPTVPCWPGSAACCPDRAGPVKPETLLRWHRRLVVGAWRYPRGPGRPPLDEDVQALIVRLGGKGR
jgi:hypothetical protein